MFIDISCIVLNYLDRTGKCIEQCILFILNNTCQDYYMDKQCIVQISSILL